MSQIEPCAVPLEICLNHIYDAQGETALEVDIAIKILQTIVTNNGLEKFRSVNATKVLPRIALDDNLALFYTLRHAGFYKDGERLVCPTTVPLTTITDIMNQLVELSQHNAKIRSGEIQPKFTPTPSPNQKQQNNFTNTNNTEVSSVGVEPTAPSPSQTMMNDNDIVQSPQQTETLPDSSSAMTGTPQTPPPTQTNQASSPLSNESTESTQTTSSPTYASKVNVANMSKEEKQAYVQALMAQKRAAKK